MKDDGYGEIKYRAQHSTLVYNEFKDGRGLGRWEDAASYQLKTFLDRAGLTEAAAGVYDGFMLTVAGMGMVVQDLNKIRGGVNDSTIIEDKLLRFTNWQKKVIRKYGMDKMQDCLAVLCHEKTIRWIDEQRGTKHPEARNNLVASLMLWQETR